MSLGLKRLPRRGSHMPHFGSVFRLFSYSGGEVSNTLQLRYGWISQCLPRHMKGINRSGPRPTR